MISRTKLLELIKNSRNKAISQEDKKTPHLDKIVDMLENHPEMLTMGILLEEINKSVLNKSGRTKLTKKLLDIPIVG